MNSGIIRRIDDLGRISIPKEIRRQLQIHENDALEIYIENDTICLKEYKPLGAISTDKDINIFIEGLCQSFGVDVAVADNRGIVMLSSIRSLLGKCLQGTAARYCSASCKEDKVVDLHVFLSDVFNVTGLSTISKNGNCEGAVFVCGNSEAAQQIAACVAGVMLEKLKEYSV